MEILVRDRIPDDLPMVFDSWLKSWRVSKWAGTIPNHLYFETQRVLIEDLIARGAKIVVAHPEGHPDVIMGWACGELKEGKTVLNYAYVKDPYLGLGILERLLAALPGEQPGFITHKLPSKALREWRHAPEMCRRKSL
jgi:hypothetical protein